MGRPNMPTSLAHIPLGVQRLADSFVSQMRGGTLPAQRGALTRLCADRPSVAADVLTYLAWKVTLADDPEEMGGEEYQAWCRRMHSQYEQLRKTPQKITPEIRAGESAYNRTKARARRARMKAGPLRVVKGGAA